MDCTNTTEKETIYNYGKISHSSAHSWWFLKAQLPLINKQKRYKIYIGTVNWGDIGQVGDFLHFFFAVGFSESIFVGYERRISK